MTFVKKTYADVSNEVEQTINLLENQTFNSEHDNLMRFDGRFVQEILKLNVHPAFYHMSLLDELERNNKENDGHNNQKKSKQSSGDMSKKYFKTHMTENGSSIGPIFDVAESAAAHKVYDGKYTVSNFESQHSYPMKASKPGSPAGLRQKHYGRVTSMQTQPNEMTPGFSGVSSKLKKHGSRQQIENKGSEANLMERDTEVASRKPKH